MNSPGRVLPCFCLALAFSACSDEPRPPTGMAFIPGGTFRMGASAGDIRERFAGSGPRLMAMLLEETPPLEVTLPDFYMDRHEVTNRQFQVFIEANPAWSPSGIDRQLHNGDYLKHWTDGRCPDDLADHPVTNITWQAAIAYAAWAGKRLPTEAEWEYAARGGRPNAEYPWGNERPTPDRANWSESGIGTTAPTGEYPPNGYGLYDLAGNVWEFCVDEWRSGEDRARLAGPDGAAGDLAPDWMAVTTRRVIRGGSFGGGSVNLRVTWRDSHDPRNAVPYVGFRCVRDAE